MAIILIKIFIVDITDSTSTQRLLLESPNCPEHVYVI